eukprot:CAMPEP_0115275726 /NCGR_PEP_ID=MMETSP0270-20121206/56347_1 /TAXON_ID=71861 /ORGANISM="Scrippsiella trochoidea, Strain CCMP3099" /LENGTH=75 /DNA_ID=CAMNT_0002692293 /DNA_START=324 /DNA_END=551 /DNA_ORIENTATION=+
MRPRTAVFKDSSPGQAFQADAKCANSVSPSSAGTWPVAYRAVYRDGCAKYELSWCQKSEPLGVSAAGVPRRPRVA